MVGELSHKDERKQVEGRLSVASRTICSFALKLLGFYAFYPLPFTFSLFLVRHSHFRRRRKLFPYLYSMPSDNNRPLKDWLQVFAQSPQLRAKLYQTRVEKMWAELMGPVISGYTRRIKLDDQTLFLFIESASLKSELTIMREQIRLRVNERLGEEFVKEVRVL